MFIFLYAALLAVATPQAVPLQSLTDIAYARSSLCIDLKQQKKTPAQVIKEANLNTAEKQTEFAIGCGQFFLGVDIGMALASRAAGE